MTKYERAREKFQSRWEKKKAERKSHWIHKGAFAELDCYTDSYALYIFRQKMTDLPENPCPLNIKGLIDPRRHDRRLHLTKKQVAEELKAKKKESPNPNRIPVHTGNGICLNLNILKEIFLYLSEDELDFYYDGPRDLVWTMNDNNDYCILCPVGMK